MLQTAPKNSRGLFSLSLPLTVPGLNRPKGLLVGRSLPSGMTAYFGLSINEAHAVVESLPCNLLIAKSRARPQYGLEPATINSIASSKSCDTCDVKFLRRKLTSISMISSYLMDISLGYTYGWDRKLSLTLRWSERIALWLCFPPLSRRPRLSLQASWGSEYQPEF